MQPSIDRPLASPNYIIWEYYTCLKRQINRVPTNDLDRTQKQELVLALFLSVSIVETFLNSYFRVVVEEEKFKTHKEFLLKAISARVTLDKKLDQWPKKILGKPLDKNKLTVKRFYRLKNDRNSLMHFKSSYETEELPGPITIHGWSDISCYKKLTLHEAKTYPKIIQEFSYEIFRANDIADNNLLGAFHQWFGEPS